MKLLKDSNASIIKLNKKLKFLTIKLLLQNSSRKHICHIDINIYWTNIKPHFWIDLRLCGLYVYFGQVHQKSLKWSQIKKTFKMLLAVLIGSINATDEKGNYRY